MSAAQGENGEMKDEPDVGPAGGAKHWTDEEKSRLFNWMLNDDDRWDQFGSKMNTIFREGSKTLFNSRKTFTALKSCYHRNLDVFKQIYAFEAFLVRAPTQSPHAIGGGGPGSPSSSSSASVMHEPADIANAPIPPAFTSAAHRQNFLEKKLEAARAMNVPVGNLTLKVVDHWHEMGWYTTFKKRFKEDPKTGLPVARHDHSETSSTISSMLAPVKQRPAVPTVRMEEEAEDESEEEDAEHVEEHLGPHSPLTHRMGNGDSASADIQHRRHAESLIPAPYQSPQPVMSRASRPQHQPSPSITQQSHVNAHTQAPSAGGYHPHNPHSPYPSPQMPHVPTYPYPSHAPTPYYHPSMDYQNPQQLIHFQSQAAQSLSHLTALTQTLIVTCNSLTELVRLQTEDSKVQTEMLRRREEREEALARKAVAVREGGENRSQDAPESLGLAQKVSLAKDVLANDDLKDEEVKRAASDYLQRVFYSKSSK
ncbi:hypothetical protein EW026_g1130 [Hermanssonia centrifuga]|uniref:Uncharacterized protein n=1 Tax=Hermanssonia centrifuga TaxID=98765 RepID=A0A4S4KT64_9APHY|nr:hypothetical protein EW026_g1130 [Hermanssonia centrifuga]